MKFYLTYTDKDGVKQTETVYDRPTLLGLVTALIWDDVEFSVTSNLAR